MNGTLLAALCIAASATLLAGGAAARTAHPPGSAASGASAAQPMRAKAAPPIDVNSASKAELRKLRGLDDATIERIVAGRPYPSKAELVTRQVLAHGIYLEIKDRIVARQPAAANAKVRAAK